MTEGQFCAINGANLDLWREMDDKDFRIVDLLSTSNGGMTVDEVERLQLGIPRRTLQRRLQQMVGAGLLVVSGHTRATRYRVVESGPSAAAYRKPTAERPSNMAATYVDLDRRFFQIAIPPDRSAEDADLSAWRIHGSSTWDDLLKNPCSVIIAEAGSGKTTELRAQANRLRLQGKQAFFARLELLTSTPLALCLEIGGSGFDQWLRGDAHGYFFLDSVDEAVLSRAGDFERAIIGFVRGIDGQLDRSTIVISSRPGAWRGPIDSDMLCVRLRLDQPAAEAGSAALPNPIEGGDPAEDSTSECDTTESRPPLAIFQLGPLDRDQIQKFAHAQAPQNADGFLSELEDDDALAFATRPDDLGGLIELWGKNGAIGSYTDVIGTNLRSKLLDATEPRAALSADRAWQGAELLAAAVVFTRISSIRISEGSVTGSQRLNSLSPQQVLKGWTALEISELLGRPLFDPSQYGCVRFHHRTFVEYLAAHWLKRLLEEGAPRRAVEKLLFATPYNDEVHVMVASMKPIAAWLSAWDQDMRDKVIRLEPRTLIEYGDAAQFDRNTREQVLRRFAAQYEDRPNTPLRASDQEVRRLAAPGLGPALRELLTQYRQHDDMRQLLLRIIRHGGARYGYSECAEQAMSFAADHTMDAYTRSCAVRACSVICGDENNADLIAQICRNASSTDRSVLAAAIAAFFPRRMATSQLVILLEQAQEIDEFASDTLSSQIEEVVEAPGNRAHREALLRALDELLSREPFVDSYCGRVSDRHSWLLAPAFELAAQFYSEDQVNGTVLSVFSKALQANHLHRYTGDTYKGAVELVLADTDLKHALFWFEIAEKRAASAEPVQDFWNALISHELLMINSDDFDRLLASVSERSLMDDKIIAIKALVRIYLHQGRPKERLKAIKKAASSDPVLLQTVSEQLSRPKPNAELRASMNRMRVAESRNRKRVAANEANRRSWIETLKADPSRVGDATLARVGQVWNNTIWLHDEIRRRQKNNSSWTVTAWQDLIEDFGVAVAQNYRDVCRAYWRQYRAELRSEAGAERNSTPWAVIISLSGLAMEANENTNWASRISKTEAENAVRLALLELNSFPSWLWTLYREQPDVVSDILLNEVRWELALTDGADNGYVLSRLRWTGKELGAVLRAQIASLLEAKAPFPARALSDAFTVILRDPSPLPMGFLELVRSRASSEQDEARRSLWIAAQICIDAKRGVNNLASWLRGVDPQLGEKRTSAVLTHIWGDSHGGFQSEHRDYKSPSHLVALIRLAHAHVRRADDIEHTGAYTPGTRDHAQSARSLLLKLLCEQPGRNTFDALLSLAKDFGTGFLRDRLIQLAEERAEADAEPPRWSGSDVAAFQEAAERMPVTEEALFGIALARLDDLKLELEEGDESEASLLRKVANELELRRVVARRLRQMARGRYATASEEELADESRTDIRLHNPRVVHRIPIELKIAEKWSAASLRERLQNQLVHQYLRESKHGILLVVGCNNPSGTKAWSLPNNGKATFEELIAWLRSEASSLRRQHPDLLGLEVVGIDLTKREQKRSSTVGQRKRKRTTTVSDG
ncbi:winged helix-turn-helix domain-containing protein [Hyphomicrobium sp. LHD-15]|uniref:winged helix-turn-helix domain-containing protein n=1 Tax=Hyphomicrobium sp. LHD-15 TaxID=3072142 RepID=UPI00280DAC22|nr:winged helix-turn-helix domain-containing protein [Hyphomicrobium sp. LHD-15]MDQ8699275.1 winged helix-turn-helix domain-containing protein [Hyphomicrobium sp. LHD-15]